MRLAGWIVAGLVVSLLAALFLGRRRAGELVLTAAVGLAGALFGGSMTHAVATTSHPGAFGQIMAAAVGAAVALGIQHMVLSATDPRSA
jgi:uncharacterized membrane protein YeaQ/YmgE (transglycosylase-associated protein family)